MSANLYRQYSKKQIIRIMQAKVDTLDVFCQPLARYLMSSVKCMYEEKENDIKLAMIMETARIILKAVEGINKTAYNEMIKGIEHGKAVTADLKIMINGINNKYKEVDKNDKD